MTVPPLTVHLTVNKPLTPKRRSRVIENDEYAAFLHRVIRAYSRRVATGDIEAITAMAALADELQDATRQAITGLRQFGYSWADIAARLGITRQGAQQRWGGGTTDGISNDGSRP
jgi:DNA-directed RNA polymerase specialized sigma24 family protein